VGQQRHAQARRVDAALLKTLPDAEKDTIGKLANGEPNGFVVDAGWDRVASKMPVPSSVDMLNAAKSAVRYNNSLGITAWMDPAANAAPGEAVFALKPTEKTVGVLPAYKALSESGDMSVHVAACWWPTREAYPPTSIRWIRCASNFRASPT
jgi:predicted amidohydrolase YtcJ